MAGNNGHSKRPIKRNQPKGKPSKLAKEVMQAAVKVIFKKNNRNN